MPTYEYRCKDCGHELEAFQKITENALKTCPQCNKDTLERLISGGNFVLKGSGWYKHGYQKQRERSESQIADKITQSQAESSKKESEKKKANSDAA